MKIAIASGKGGTGKTTLSTNLSHYLAERQSVVLVDLDVEEPNSNLFVKGDLVLKENQFKMIPEWKGECSLCGLCQEVCNYHAVLRLGTQIMVFPQLCHSCYACSEMCPDNALPMVPQKMGEMRTFRLGNLIFVEGRLNIGQEQAVPLISKVTRYVGEHFTDEEWIIFDSPPGTSCPVIEAVKPADFVILVTEPTPFGLHDLKLAVETMQQLNKSFGVVINRYGIGDNKVEQYLEEHQIPLLAQIPNQRKIAELYSQGKLIYPFVPKMKAQLGKITEYLQRIKGRDSR